MPEQDPARRAVITGLGAVMPIGNDFPTYWANLQAGVTGTRTIRSFDASTHEVRIAAEVLDFDPTTVMDPKMARRMSRFIQGKFDGGRSLNLSFRPDEFLGRVLGGNHGAAEVPAALDVQTHLQPKPVRLAPGRYVKLAPGG